MARMTKAELEARVAELEGATVGQDVVTRREAKGGALVYVVLTTLISAGLNAYANSLHAQGTVAVVLASVLGITIPALVLLLGWQAGRQWKLGNRTLAYMLAVPGLVVLSCSLVHCTEAIQLLTGSSYWLCALMAFGIDAGMVASEVAATQTE